MTANTEASTSKRFGPVAIWVLQIIAAAAFLTAGSLKLIGAPRMILIFDHIGVGQWFRYVTGAVEVTGGLALLFPKTAAFGGLLLAATMICAIYTHLAIIGGTPIPAAVLFSITATVAYVRRESLIALLKSFR